MTEAPAYLAYYEMLRTLDRRGATGLVQRLLDEGTSIEDLYVEIFMPALAHTGTEWESGRISVAHEHYITEVTRELIRRLGPRLWADPPDPASAPVAVVCCAPGEMHGLGLTMVSDVLRGEGVEVHSLGEGAPREDICRFLVEVGADLFGLSVALPQHLDDAADLIAQAREARPGIAVLVGGAAFEGDRDLALGLGADHFAADAKAVRALGPGVLKKLPA